jgi:predicted ATP-dependent serine protease
MQENMKEYPAFVCNKCGHISLVRFNHCPKCKIGSLSESLANETHTKINRQYSKMMKNAVLIAILTALVLGVFIFIFIWS